MAKNRFVPADLVRIRQLTAENSHTLAMWYAAHQLGLEYLERESATLVCRQLLEGSLTPDLEICVRRVRARLLSAMTVAEVAAFLGVT
jgi:hypothetical protein